MSSQSSADVVTIFPQRQPGAGGESRPWIQEDSDFADTACTLANAQLFHIPTIRHPALRTTWRGQRILSEEDLAKTDCPYPPEREWEDR
ncbi:MAG: hypothetical protein ACUVYA_13665 [Planctomycetota bacterium]